MADLSPGPGLLRESEASEASRVLFWLRVLAIESIDMACFELLHAWSRPIYSLYFPEIFSQSSQFFQVKYRNFSCWKQTVTGDILLIRNLDFNLLRFQYD